MSATFCIVHCTKRPLNEPVLAIKSDMQLHGTLETLNNDKYYCLTHVPSPQNANLVMGARTSYMRLTACVEPHSFSHVANIACNPQTVGAINIMSST